MTKIVTNKRADRYVDRLTTLREGLLGHQGDKHRDEMFIDPSPYCSLTGLHLGATPEERSRASAKNPRAGVDLGDHARARTTGKTLGGKSPHQSNRPLNYRGAPPCWPSHHGDYDA